jgi:hypothetical protein
MSIVNAAFEEITSGKKKNELMQWWLKTIEEKVEEFLKGTGFQLNSIPDDYTSVPPENIELVEKNLQILEDLVKRGVEQLEFIQLTTADIYVAINPFIEQMDYVLTLSKVGFQISGYFLLFLFLSFPERKYVTEMSIYFCTSSMPNIMSIISSFSLSQETPTASLTDLEFLSRNKRLTNPTLFDTDLDRINFEKDLMYLRRMKEMDEQIAAKWKAGELGAEKLQMTDVVPVSGLVQARFSILECELRTVLEMWGPKKKPVDGDFNPSIPVFFYYFYFHFKSNWCLLNFL